MKNFLTNTLLIAALLIVTTGITSAKEKPVPNVYDLGIYVTDLKRTKKFYTTVFGLKVVREWKTMDVSFDNKTFTSVNNPGLYLAGENGMHLEFLQRAKTENRQEKQEPINHFAIEVEDVRKAFELAVSSGAKPAFEDERLQYAKIGDLSVIHTQIIGLDGERIQILKVLDEKTSK